MTTLELSGKMRRYLQRKFETDTERLYEMTTLELSRKMRWRYGDESALHCAAFLGDVDATKMLIEENVDVNAVDEGNQTALHWAAREGHVDVVKVLIENGADVNAVQYIERTALHLAADEGYIDLVKVLIENGADVNAVDEDEETSLHLAAHRGQVEIAKVLIQNGGDVNAVDWAKSTALRIAAIKRHIPYVLQLLCFGTEIDEKAIKDDKTKLLRPIECRLKSLRDGKRMEVSLMSDEERRFMWDLGFVLAVKHPAIAFATYERIRSFVTFHGIFMGPGYCLGKGSVWRR